MQMVYRLMDYLDTAQTADWLRIKTGKPISTTDLMELSSSSCISPYVRVTGLKGWITDLGEKVCAAIGFGYQEVLDIMASRESNSPGMLNLLLKGVVGVPDFTGDSLFLCAFVVDWEAEVESECLPFFFKSSDIQALADKINGGPEGEAAKARAELGVQVLTDIQDTLKNKTELDVLQERVDEAERMVASLTSQLHEQAEIKRVSDSTFNALIAKLRQKNQGAQPDNPEMSSTTALTFPYVTKELKAMHSAALKYWANHTSEKRNPTQI